MPCKHQSPRYDGIILKGCFECEGNNPRPATIHFAYGKEDWHGPTIKERLDEHHAANEAQGRKLGRDYESSSRWV